MKEYTDFIKSFKIKNTACVLKIKNIFSETIIVVQYVTTLFY